MERSQRFLGGGVVGLERQGPLVAFRRLGVLAHLGQHVSAADKGRDVVGFDFQRPVKISQGCRSAPAFIWARPRSI